MLLVGVAPAGAAPAWLPPKQFADALGFADGVDVATNRAGVTAVAWVGAPNFGQADHVLRLAVHRPGADWVVVPTAVDAGAGFIPCDPHVGVDDAGGVTVVWRQISKPNESDLCSSGASTTVQA